MPAVVVEAPLEDVPAVPAAAAAAANNGGESGDSGNEDEGQFSDPEAEQGAAAAAAVRPISPQVQAAGPGFAAALEQERGEEKSR